MAYKVYKDVLYMGWADYEGDVEYCTFTFKTGPEQLDWLGQKYYVNKMISAAKDKVAEQGGTILRLTVERDKAPTFETRYRVTIGAHHSPAIFVWAVLILGIFALIGFVVAFTILAVWLAKWTPEEVLKGIKWTTYAIIGGGALACVAALIITRGPPKKAPS